MHGVGFYRSPCRGGRLCPPEGPLYQEGAVSEGDWGSFKIFSPLIVFDNLSPLYEEGGFPLRRSFIFP